MSEADISITDSTKWALRDTTKCGLRAYMRPCQTLGCEGISYDSAPLADQCATPNQMVFIVEDDTVLREELVEIVASQGHAVMGMQSAMELQSMAQTYETGCVILDIRLPGQDGLSIQEWMNGVKSPFPIIFLSGVRDVATIVSCMKAGAVEFLPKPFEEMALRRAVNTAIGVSRQRHCLQVSQDLIRRLVAKLTPTELVVAKLIARGYPTKSIANELGRSENTVKIHRHRIFSKLSVSSAASVGNIIAHADLSRD